MGAWAWPLAAAVLSACSAPAAHVYGRAVGEGLGTRWTVQWAPADRVERGAVEAAIVAALVEVDAAMSTWRDDSELARVRLGPGAVPVSEETADVVRVSLALAEATGGAFDPTVQPLVELWGLHGAPRTAWPTDAELASARAATGWERVHVGRGAAGGATVDAGGTALDLSAIAKGHAVDRVLLAVSALGATDVFVEVGGEVRTAGRAPSGGPWRVGVERPVVGGTPADGLAGAVAVTNAAVATSGNYRSRYVLDGRVVHHTLDPRTGLPARADVLSATVVAPDCRAADGWATALMVLGEAGLPLVEARPDLEAWLLVADGDGWRPVATAGMRAFLFDTDPGAPVGAD